MQKPLNLYIDHTLLKPEATLEEIEKLCRESIEYQSVSSPIVKVILETCLLTDEEKQTASLLSIEAGASFVKTSTGFSKSGATIQDVTLMRNVVGPEFGVKASGGIRDLSTALAMIKAGATRIGTSSSVAIMQSMRSEKDQVCPFFKYFI